MNTSLHPSTNPEILVKIGPLGSELPGLESRPLKGIKNKEKTLAKYIAIPASLTVFNVGVALKFARRV